MKSVLFILSILLFPSAILGRIFDEAGPQLTVYESGIQAYFDDAYFFEKLSGPQPRVQEGFQFYVDGPDDAYCLSVYKDLVSRKGHLLWRMAIKKVRIRSNGEALAGYRGETLVVFIDPSTEFEVEREVLGLIMSLNSLNEEISTSKIIDTAVETDPVRGVTHMIISICRGTGADQRALTLEYSCPYSPKPEQVRPRPFDVYETTLLKILRLSGFK